MSRRVPGVALPAGALLALALLAWSVFQGPCTPRSEPLVRTETPAEHPPSLRGRPRADPDGVAAATHDVPDPPRGLDADGQLLPGVEWLTGTVRAHDGTPVPGASVHVWNYRFGPSNARTGTDGTYRVTVPTDDEFRLFVEAETRGRDTRYGLWWAADTPLDIDLPSVFTGRGRVVYRGSDGGWIGVPHVRVRAYAFELAYYRGESAHGGSFAGKGVFTDEDGSFTYPGIVHSGHLHVISDAWFQPEGPEGWKRGEESRIVVLPRRSVSGVVLGTDDRPLPGALVKGGGRARSESTRTTTTDARGRFVLPGLALKPGSKPLTLRASLGAEKGSATIEAQAVMDVHDVIVRCRARPWIHGRVVDRMGRAVEGADIVSKRVSEGEPDGPWEGERATTKGDGRFVLYDLPDADATVVVYATDHHDLRVGVVRPTPGGIDLGTQTLDPLPTQRIRVTDEEGTPIQDATVEGLAVDERGVAVLFVDPEEELVVTIKAPGYSSRTCRKGDFAAGDVWTLRLEPCLWIEGRVLDIEGAPVCSAQVSAWGDGGGERTFSNLAGRFRIGVPIAGSYRVSAWDLFHHYPPPREVEVDGREVLIQALVPCHVAGRLLDPQGRGIKGAAVYADLEGRDDWRSRPDTTDEDGAFRIDDLVESPFRVWANREHMNARGLRVRSLRGVLPFTTDLVLQTEPLGTPRGPHRVHGTVVWPDGRPAAEAEVEISLEGVDDDWFDGSAESAPDGTFAIEGLRAGRYAVWAWSSIEIDADRDGEAESEVEYECDAGVIDVGPEAGVAELRIVLRAVPPDPDDDEPSAEARAEADAEAASEETDEDADDED